MDASSDPNSNRLASMAGDPVVLPLTPPDPSEKDCAIVTLTLTHAQQQRIEVIQQVMAARGTARYAGVQRQAARTLGMSVRSLRRLVRSWQERGLAGLTRQSRSDQGASKLSEEWHRFIVKTYRDSNRGSRSLSPAQVFVRVRARAQELGVEDYPSRTTVYRVLKPELEKQHSKRSLGWRGERLRIATREGLEIGVEWSNQVWQCDHTKIDLLVVDQAGSLLGRPWLTIVVDTYSRCIMGIHLGFDAPSAAVVCLGLRHAVLPKQYPVAYELRLCRKVCKVTNEPCQSRCLKRSLQRVLQ